MNTVLIHGQSHKGSTYNISRKLAESIGGNITEFFLPRDFGCFCTGCFKCINESEKLCPHYEKLKPITEDIDKADVIILASPVYVFHATGAMKALLDHYAYRWLMHRPEKSMLKKQAVCISTAAGAGMKSANRDMYDSLLYWGVGRIYKYGAAVMAASYDGVNPKKKIKIENDMVKLADRIKANAGRVKPCLKTRLYVFAIGSAKRLFGIK